MLYFSSYLQRGRVSYRSDAQDGRPRGAYLVQELLHDLGAVVDGEDDVCDAGGDEGLDLVDYHGLVAELDEGLGEGEGLLRMEISGRPGGCSWCRRTYERAQAGAEATDEDEACGGWSAR